MSSINGVDSHLAEIRFGYPADCGKKTVHHCISLLSCFFSTTKDFDDLAYSKFLIPHAFLRLGGLTGSYCDSDIVLASTHTLAKGLCIYDFEIALFDIFTVFIVAHCRQYVSLRRQLSPESGIAQALRLCIQVVHHRRPTWCSAMRH